MSYCGSPLPIHPVVEESYHLGHAILLADKVATIWRSCCIHIQGRRIPRDLASWTLQTEAADFFFVASATLCQETLRCIEKLRSAFLLLFIRTVMSLSLGSWLFYISQITVSLYIIYFLRNSHPWYTAVGAAFCFVGVPAQRLWKWLRSCLYTVREIINRFKFKVTVGEVYESLSSRFIFISDNFNDDDYTTT